MRQPRESGSACDVKRSLAEQHFLNKIRISAQEVSLNLARITDVAKKKKSMDIKGVD